MQYNENRTPSWDATLPGYAGQVGQHVVKLPVCDLSERGELWEDDDGAAVVSSTSWRTDGKHQRELG